MFRGICRASQRAVSSAAKEVRMVANLVTGKDFASPIAAPLGVGRVT